MTAQFPPASLQTKEVSISLFGGGLAQRLDTDKERYSRPANKLFHWSELANLKKLRGLLGFWLAGSPHT